MTKIEKENQITALKKLGLNENEIAEVLADDEKIDKGAKLFNLPNDLEQGSRKARQAGNCKGYTKPTNKEKKSDPDKGKLIGDLLDGIPYAEDVKIINPEREFEFTFKNRKYKIVLSCPRK